MATAAAFALTVRLAFSEKDEPPIAINWVAVVPFDYDERGVQLTVVKEPGPVNAKVMADADIRGMRRDDTGDIYSLAPDQDGCEECE